ncbi:hypothetical protein D3C75_733700 [compost metagenome]
MRRFSSDDNGFSFRDRPDAPSFAPKLLDLDRPSGPGVAVAPVVFVDQPSVALNGESELALIELQRAVGALGLDPFAIDPDVFFGVDTNGGDSRASVTFGDPLAGIGGWAGCAVGSGRGLRVAEPGLGIFRSGFVDVAALQLADLGATGGFELFAVFVVDGVGWGLGE